MAYYNVLLYSGIFVLIHNKFSYALGVPDGNNHKDPHAEVESRLPSLEVEIFVLILVVRYIQNYKKNYFAVGRLLTSKWGLQIHNATLSGVIKVVGLIFYCAIWRIVVLCFTCARYGSCSTFVPKFFQIVMEMICQITSSDRVFDYLMQTPVILVVLLSEIPCKYAMRFEKAVDFSEDNNMHVWCSAGWVDLAQTKQFGVDDFRMGDRERNNDDVHNAQGEDDALNENEEPAGSPASPDHNENEEPGSPVGPAHNNDGNGKLDDSEDSVNSEVLNGDDKLKKETKSKINQVINPEESGHTSRDQQEYEINANAAPTPSTLPHRNSKKKKKTSTLPKTPTRSSGRLKNRNSSIHLNS